MKNEYGHPPFGEEREAHLKEIRLGLINRWIGKATPDNYPKIAMEAELLMHERGFPNLTIKVTPGKYLSTFNFAIES